MSEDWWSTPAGVQSVLREEIKTRESRIEELEAKLAQQDDLVQAAVAAALREAINRVSGCDRISEVQPAILALIREGGE